MNSFRLLQLLGGAPWCFAATYIPCKAAMELILFDTPNNILALMGIYILSSALIIASGSLLRWLDDVGWTRVESWYAKERERHSRKR